MYSLVKITANFKHDYLKKGDQYMALLNHESKNLQFILKNGYPTSYGLTTFGENSFDVEPLSGFFGRQEFQCDFGQNMQ